MFEEKYINLKVNIDGEKRTTLSPITFETKQYKIVVPKGFITDLGSIPIMLQPIFPKDGKAMFGYILHDYLYQMGLFTRDESDDILEDAMHSLGVSYFRGKSVRIGLKIGGQKAWNEHREIEKLFFKTA